MAKTHNRLPWMASASSKPEPVEEPRGSRPVLRFFRTLECWKLTTFVLAAFILGQAVGAFQFWLAHEEAKERTLQEPEPSEAVQRLAEQLIKERATNGM